MIRFINLGKMSNRIVEDELIDYLLEGICLMVKDSNSILQAFDDMLFQDIGLNQGAKDDILVNNNALKEKKHFDSFSEILAELSLITI